MSQKKWGPHKHSMFPTAIRSFTMTAVSLNVTLHLISTHWDALLHGLEFLY